MAITNKIETAVKRLLVAGKVCSLWDDEDANTELAGLLSDSSFISNLPTEEAVTLTARISVDEQNNANPSLDTVNGTIGSSRPLDTNFVRVTVTGTFIELSNYSGGTHGEHSYFMEGGNPPADNYNRALFHTSNPSRTYVVNRGSSITQQSFSYSEAIQLLPSTNIQLKLDSVDGLALPAHGFQQIAVSVEFFNVDTDAPKCTKGEDYHNRDMAAFQVIANKGEEVPPLSGNYLVNVRVLCSAQADDGLGGLAEAESHMDALRAALDTDDLAARITQAANGGLTIFPNSIWGRGVTEGVEGRKFSSGWEFTCMACEADL
ncbi:MAG: hypothetical protein EB141_20070 [Verrucomicrobia bacterium]|nr:hypothetical protein [Pseudomonadota bacterium]NDB77909.1 hypothetical protein [Verrucomicrobiota bacterium]NDD40589.1 hypothetical protein [Verrucomicrobiota bacterium]NDF01027.1 hypothetical protein [Verrucomicrobiota bacterium]